MRYVTLLMALSATPLFSQDFQVRRVEYNQGKFNIYYNLNDTIAGRVYSLNLYASRDNFLSPLINVTGDAGLEVKPGINKKMVWDAAKEWGTAFDGRVALEVRGKIYIPFVRFERFEEYKSLKRGKPYTVSWTGGSTQNILHFELFKGEKRTGVVFTDVANTGKYKMILPGGVKPGKNYRFQISDTRNKDEIVYTGEFSVKRKVPLLLKVFPVLAAGAAVYLLTGGEKSTERIPDPVNPN